MVFKYQIHELHWEFNSSLWNYHTSSKVKKEETLIRSCKELLGTKVSEVAQSCLTLCDPTDCSLPGSSIHGIFQARVLEWVATSFSRRSSRPRDWTRVSHTVGRRFTVWATREVPRYPKEGKNGCFCSGFQGLLAAYSDLFLSSLLVAYSNLLLSSYQNFGFRGAMYQIKMLYFLVFFAKRNGHIMSSSKW